MMDTLDFNFLDLSDFTAVEAFYHVSNIAVLKLE